MVHRDDVARFRADGYLLPGRQLFGLTSWNALEGIFDEHLGQGGKLSDELDAPTSGSALLSFCYKRGPGHGRAAGGPDIAWTSHFISKTRAGPGHALARGIGVLERPFRRVRPFVTVWLSSAPATGGGNAGDPRAPLQGGSRQLLGHRQTVHTSTRIPSRREPGGASSCSAGSLAHDGRIVHCAKPNTMSPADRRHLATSRRRDDEPVSRTRDGDPGSPGDTTAPATCPRT